MPRKVPSYGRHKHSGQAVVRIGGRDHYLGRYGSPESHAQYERVVAERRADRPGGTISGSRTGQTDMTHFLSVDDLVLAYWRFAKSYYVKAGRPTDEQAGIRCALRRVRQLYGNTPAEQFGPLALEAVRQTMIDDNLSRGYINQSVRRIRRMLRWAVSKQMLPVEVYQALTTLSGLQRGRSQARETSPVMPVPDHVVRATLAQLPPIVRAMVEFQRLTGCRPNGVCVLRPCDVETGGEIWCYRPETHKTEHLGHERRIYVGPKAQSILRRCLVRPADSYCFSPRESTEASLAARRSNPTAVTMPSRSTRPPKDTSIRTAGTRYTRHSYRQAIERACKRAGVPRWTPNQLRHSLGTEVRQRFGLEATQTVLGHSRADVTQVYAERDYQLAMKVMREVG